MTVNELSLAEALDEVVGGAGVQIATIKDAIDELWNKLAEGEISAAAVSTSPQGRPVQIPRHEWPYLKLAGDLSLQDELRFNSAPISPAYREVTLVRVDVLRLWPGNDGISATTNTAKTSKEPTRQSPQQARVVPILEALYPAGVPDRSTVTDAELYKAVADTIGANPPSRETVLRAAGRRK